MESPEELGATCYHVMPQPRNRRVSNSGPRRGTLGFNRTVRRSLGTSLRKAGAPTTWAVWGLRLRRTRTRPGMATDAAPRR